MNAFSFTNSVLNLIQVKQGKTAEFVTAKIADYRMVAQPDGSEKPVQNCSRFITIFDAELVQWVKENLNPEAKYLVNASGYFTSQPDNTKKDAKGNAIWYENQVVTELELA